MELAAPARQPRTIPDCVRGRKVVGDVGEKGVLVSLLLCSVLQAVGTAWDRCVAAQLHKESLELKTWCIGGISNMVIK